MFLHDFTFLIHNASWDCSFSLIEAVKQSCNLWFLSDFQILLEQRLLKKCCFWPPKPISPWPKLYNKHKICIISRLYIFIDCDFIISHSILLSAGGVLHFVRTRMNHLMTLCFCPSQPFFIYLPLSLYLTYHPPFLSLSAFSPFWVLNRSFPLLFSLSLPFCFSEHQPLPKQQVQTALSGTLRSPVLPYPDSHFLSLERACQYLPAACSCLLTVLLEHAVTFDSENLPFRD